MTKTKRNIIIALVFLAAVCFYFWQFYSSSVKVIVKPDRTLLQPGFYFHTGVSKQGVTYRSDYIYLQNDRLSSSDDKYTFSYRGSYPTERFDWLDQQTERTLGQVMFYRKYKMGEIFVCDDWHNGAKEWSIIVIDKNDTITEYFAQKSSEFDSLHYFCADENAFYLHRRTQSDEIIISKVSVSDGTQRDYILPMDSRKTSLLGQINLLSYFNADDETLSFLYREGSETHLATYDFNTFEFKTMPLDCGYTRIVSDGTHYFLICQNISCRLFIAKYDLNWNHISDIESVPYTDGEQVSALGGIRDFDLGPSAYLHDGALYFCSTGNEGTLFYAVDIESGEVLASYAIAQAKEQFLSDFEVYDENGISPYTTLK
ncbi:MAG: hypothetical protein IJO95_00885 [Clostridia bacterium]|nr:hypothetical protein [Clostridia bacterium]